MGTAIAIGTGIRIHQAAGAGILFASGEVSCYAMGVWIDEGVYRMDDIWPQGITPQASGTKVKTRRK